jgi:hypothetical protein
LAYLEIFDPYRLFPILKGTETDLAAAVLRYLLVSELFGLVNGTVELP